MFIHLNCHSNYSLLSGADTLGDLVQAAAQMGCSSLALTDTHALYGAVAFYRLAKSCGVRPILGTEITDTTQAKKTGEPYLGKCGGTYSSEWFWSKIFHCRRTNTSIF